MGLKDEIINKLDELEEKYPDDPRNRKLLLLFGLLAWVGCVITLVVGVVTLGTRERVDATLSDLQYHSAGRGGVCYATFDYTFQEKEFHKTIQTNHYLLYHEGPTHVYVDYDGSDPTTVIEQLTIPVGCFLGGVVLVLTYIYDDRRRKRKALRQLQEEDITWD